MGRVIGNRNLFALNEKSENSSDVVLGRRVLFGRRVRIFKLEHFGVVAEFVQFRYYAEVFQTIGNDS